ncbi:MBL fold metallo-hydrolase [Singulisphaera sp. Ch08]|uniref:MBL fold metallo-hydrolase n=1 Tax=Singulisphaera sp. Ch08 TaxID=3120278 RepID=A0AAU7CQL4_9BACT
MIEPIQAGGELLDQIAATNPAPGSLVIWWLGQSGYLVKSSTGTMVIDPYLSEHLTTKYEGTGKPHVRMTRSPFRGFELRRVDLVLSSHKHSDHLDPGTMPELLETSPEAPLLLPEALIEHAVGLGLPTDRLVGLDAGGDFRHRGFRIEAIPSAHEGLDTDERGRHLYLGYIIEVEGLRLYHSGDTLLYDGLVGHLGDRAYDVLFLPINGRDPARGVAGNMSAAEAVTLASVVKPRYLVPHHYEMFAFNTVPIGDFESEALRLPAGVNPRVLRCGERWEIKR